MLQEKYGGSKGPTEVEYQGLQQSNETKQVSKYDKYL